MFLFLGLLFIFQGIIIWKKQMVTLTFDCNSKNVKKEDVKHYTKSFGIAYSIIGVAMLLVIIAKVAYNSRFQDAGYIIFLVAFIISMTIIVKTQIKFKTGLFN
jgi:hypothetical protein